MSEAEKSQTRIEWLKARRKGIGGSDASAILGLNSYRTALEVYLEKISDGEPNDQTSEPAEWGNRLEEAVAKKFQDNHPEIHVSRASGILKNNEHPFMIANPDRILVDGDYQTILECKTANARLLPAWEAGEIPDAYQIQIQHYMSVINLDYCWLACLVGGQRYFEFRVERNQELIDALIKHEGEFWTMVQNRTPPAVTAFDNKSLESLFPTRKGTVLDLPEYAEAEIVAFEEAKANLKACEEEKDLRANRIKEMMAGAETGLLGKYKVSWKEQTQIRVDSDAVRTKYPEIMANVSKTISFRKFEIREVKEKRS